MRARNLSGFAAEDFEVKTQRAVWILRVAFFRASASPMMGATPKASYSKSSSFIPSPRRFLCKTFPETSRAALSDT